MNHLNKNVTFLTLISCGGTKQELDEDETVPAKELYNSGVHTVKVNYAEASNDYRILSAKFGLVHPDEDLPWYDLRLGDQPLEYRKDWAATVAGDLADTIDAHDIDAIVIIGSDEYAHPLILQSTDAGITIPIFTPWQSNDEINKIGQYMAWCNEEANRPQNLNSIDTAILGEPRSAAEPEITW